MNSGTLLCSFLLAAQMAQNPSPMSDSTRAHVRLPHTEPPGQHWKLSLGTLFLPAGVRAGKIVPLIVHFHGAAWVAESSARRAVLVVNLGSGSSVYARAFSAPERFAGLLAEAARALDAAQPPAFRPVLLSSFSAGYGAIREILSVRDNWPRIDAVLLADSLHTSYLPEGKPGPLATDNLKPFADFAREAAAGRKRMLVTHSEIYPGTFASTTETADFLLAALGLKRRAVVRWGPLGMQQLSEARAGHFRLLGFAGNTAPDHIDHLHALGRWLQQIRD